MKHVRPLIGFLIVAVVLAQSAHAESFFGRLIGVQEDWEASVSFNSITLEEDESTRLMQDFLSGMALKIHAGPNSDFGTLCWGDAEAFLTAEDDNDPTIAFLRNANALEDDLGMLCSAWYSLLDENTENRQELKNQISIKNTASSARLIRYQYAADDMNALWPRLLLAIPAGLTPLQQLFEKATQFSWNSASFTAPCTINRLIDKNEVEFALTVSSRITFDGDSVYKLSFTGGCLPDVGGYFSLEMVKMRGTGQHKWSLGWKITDKNAVYDTKVDASWQTKTNNHSANFTLQGNITDSLKDNNETLKVSFALSGSRDGLKSSSALEMNLASDGQAADGTIKVNRSVAGQERWQISLDCSLQPQMAVFDDNSDTAEQTNAELIFVEALRRMSRLNEDERILLTHTLRTSEWMNMNSQQDHTIISSDSEWSVKEEP